MHFYSVFDEKYLLEQIKLSKDSTSLMSAYGLFCDGDFKSANELLIPYIKNNHSLALILSAMFQKEDETDEVFFRRHLKYMEIAMNQKNSIAIYVMAVYFDNGDLVQQDKVKACELYKASSELGMPLACHMYGVMLYYGTGGAIKDQKNGLELIRFAASENVAEAVEFLAYISA